MRGKSNRNCKWPYKNVLRRVIAEHLSKGMPHVRADLYVCNGQIYFSELTFFDGSGFEEFEPMEWDYKIGEMLELPKIN